MPRIPSIANNSLHYSHTCLALCIWFMSPLSFAGDVDNSIIIRGDGKPMAPVFVRVQATDHGKPVAHVVRHGEPQGREQIALVPLLRYSSGPSSVNPFYEQWYAAFVPSGGGWSSVAVECRIGDDILEASIEIAHIEELDLEVAREFELVRGHLLLFEALEGGPIALNGEQQLKLSHIAERFAQSSHARAIRFMLVAAEFQMLSRQHGMRGPVGAYAGIFDALEELHQDSTGDPINVEALRMLCIGKGWSSDFEEAKLLAGMLAANCISTRYRNLGKQALAEYPEMVRQRKAAQQ